MKQLPLAIFSWLIGSSLLWAGGQNYAPPPSKKPDGAALKAIKEKTARLNDLLAALERQGYRDPYMAEVEIFRKAASWAVQYDEFYAPESGNWTLAALDEGIKRAEQISKRQAPWLRTTGRSVVRAYRSSIDGSVQPYAVTFPAEFGKDLTKKWRLDVVLHGRDPSLNEVKFLHLHQGDKEAPKEQAYIEVDIFGRGNNGYRWAGENDVIEALDNFLAVERTMTLESTLERTVTHFHLIDLERVVLRGFSMGGAGTWQIGLHAPTYWCLLGPGAGFTQTHGYVKDLPEHLSPPQEACLTIYDAVDYAENAFNVPIVAYAGEKDPQLQAARNIEARLKPLGIPMQLIVGTDLGHQFPPEWQQKAEHAYESYLNGLRDPYPPHLHFVTYTLRYSLCSWLEVVGLERHYQKAVVDAEYSDTGYTVRTANVRALHLMMQPNPPLRVNVKIDGQALTTRPWMTRDGNFSLYLEKLDGTWREMLPQKLLTDRLRKIQKTVKLQGPIDDVCHEPFVCVRGTGKPWHPATRAYAEASLKRFEDEWRRHFRGSLIVRDDVDVTDLDLAERHLVLFGDPVSNSFIGQALDRLPIHWTSQTIKMGGKEVSSADHVPVLIYPSPFNSSKYLVINSGHTFHEPDFRGTNALLYPRLGDYAILKPAPTPADPAAADTVLSGIFDEYWQVPTR